MRAGPTFLSITEQYRTVESRLGCEKFCLVQKRHKKIFRTFLKANSEDELSFDWWKLSKKLKLIDNNYLKNQEYGGAFTSYHVVSNPAFFLNGKYAMMVMNVQHFKAAMITGNAFYKKSPKVKFQIIACGNLVKEIAENPELKKEVAKVAQIPGHQVVICGLSIRQLNVDSAKLPKEAVITDNALLYSFGLQEMGYKMLIL